MRIAIRRVHTARSILIIILIVFYYVIFYTLSYNNVFAIRHDLPKFNYFPPELKASKHFRQITITYIPRTRRLYSNRFKHSKCQNTYIKRVV